MPFIIVRLLKVNDKDSYMIYFQNLRLFVLVFTILSLSTAPILAVSGKAETAKRPLLVVMIAVDGLGADIFNRYDSLYTGGFRRLRQEGMNFTKATVNHSISISHPGHVTLSSGMNPTHHGIVDAAFYKRNGEKWEYVDAVRDSSENIIGEANSPGASGRNVLVSTLPEWIIKADPQARFVALGSGQYSSLLHAGQTRGDVFWYDISAARYVTSSYYRKDYPDWFERFNKEELPRYVESSAVWESTVPEEGRKLARRDDAPYEGYRGHTTLPHIFKNESSRANNPKALYGWFKGVPTADEATLALAKEAVRACQLGQRNSTDYLSIVVSQVDDISHSYGSGSQEQLDNMLRLDRKLGEFFTFLDEQVGKGNYVVALSADHGMMDIPEYLVETGKPARRITENEVNTVVKSIQKLVTESRSTDSREQVTAKIAKAVKEFDFVEEVMTPQQLLGKSKTDNLFLTLQRNSYSADRVPRFPLFDLSNGTSPIGEFGLAVRLKKWNVINFDRGVHGSPYEYDREVPLIFMGAGVSTGNSNKEVHTTDVAPTLAALAGIPAPSSLDGRSLLTKKNQNNTASPKGKRQ